MVTSALVVAAVWQTAAQPTIVSVVPPTGTSGVSPTDPVVFTFSTAMDTNRTSAQFYTSISTPPYAYFYTTTAAWNTTSNVLTCTPSPAFASPTQVVWTVTGRDPNGTALGGTKVGHFSTGSSSSGGTGTNALTTFIVGRVNLYDQAATGQPTLDPVEPYVFIASTTLASNRTANSITLTLPNTGVSNLVQNPSQLENWNFGAFNTNEAVLGTNFPPATYTFTVNATASNQMVDVSFPASLAQPGAPHLTNLVAAQSVDSTQPFTLHWDPFTGGASTDFVLAMVGNAWQSPNPATSNALNGTSTSVTIPAGTLEPGSTYTASLGFSHPILVTNGTYVTYVYRATDTKFSLITTAGTAPPPVVTNLSWSAGAFGFDVLSSAGQTVTVVYTTNPTDALASWPVVQTFTNPGASVHFTDPHSVSNPAAVYRVRNGN
jgi:hypothetical protein